MMIMQLRNKETNETLNLRVSLELGSLAYKKSYSLLCDLITKGFILIATFKPKL